MYIKNLKRKINFQLINKFIINNRKSEKRITEVYKHGAESVECKRRKIVNKTCHRWNVKFRIRERHKYYLLRYLREWHIS